MRTHKDLPRHKLTVLSLIFNQTTFIASVLAVFVLLHVLAGSVVQRAEEGVGSARDLKSRLYD